MSANAFEDRVARLEEHLVEPDPVDDLADAERYLAKGELVWARLSLSTAKLQRRIDEGRATRELDEWEEDDDA